MSDELNFCPFCNASGHKIAAFPKDTLFCRECNRFFRLEPLSFRCPKCNSRKIVDSDFPSPDGQLVFHCQSCKKMVPAREFWGMG